MLDPRGVGDGLAWAAAANWRSRVGGTVTSRNNELRPQSLMRLQAGSAAENSKLVQRAVRHAQAGDREGIHFLYVRFAPDVQRFVNSLVKDHHEAEDITQNIFAKLMSSIVKYEPRDVPFAAWIMRVARNAALDHLRAKRPLPAEEVRIADTGRAQVAQDRGRQLRHALEELPQDQREVLILRHIAGLSPVEIAARLEKSESSVHGLHHRGRRALRAKLTELGAGPVVASGV